MSKEVGRNAEGDLFEITRRNGEWCAEQITGTRKNYMGIGALLHAATKPALLRDLASHTAMH